MPRILGIDVPNDKQVRVALTYIHGIGQTVSDRLLNSVGIAPDLKAKELSDEELARIADEALYRAKEAGRNTVSE